jgi:hypothetical protein
MGFGLLMVTRGRNGEPERFRLPAQGGNCANGLLSDVCVGGRLDFNDQVREMLSTIRQNTVAEVAKQPKYGRL